MTALAGGSATSGAVGGAASAAGAAGAAGGAGAGGIGSGGAVAGGGAGVGGVVGLGRGVTTSVGPASVGFLPCAAVAWKVTGQVPAGSRADASHTPSSDLPLNSAISMVRFATSATTRVAGTPCGLR